MRFVPMVATPPLTLGREMFEALSTYLRDYKEAFAAGRNLDLPALKDLDHVVLTGMGGSGIGGSLAAALVRDSSRLPVVVAKDYQLPQFVGKRTLVVATSYSGETEETLMGMADALARGAHIAGIASGGALAKFCGKRKAPLYRVPAGRQPRAALPLLFGALAGMMDRLGLASLELSSSDENILTNRHVRLQPRLAGVDDEALRYAQTLCKATATIYGNDHLAPVAVRWKCQLNENAKCFARAEVLPEASHNDLVPWAAGASKPSDCLVLLRRADEPPAVRARFDFQADVARNAKVPVITARSEARSRIGQTLDLLMLGDYTSVYTAVLRGVDPVPVDVIAQLKARLAREGVGQEARKRLGI